MVFIPFPRLFERKWLQRRRVEFELSPPISHSVPLPMKPPTHPGHWECHTFIFGWKQKLKFWIKRKSLLISNGSNAVWSLNVKCFYIRKLLNSKCADLTQKSLHMLHAYSQRVITNVRYFPLVFMQSIYT